MEIIPLTNIKMEFALRTSPVDRKVCWENCFWKRRLKWEAWFNSRGRFILG
jgi:hypothetical protein